LVDQDLAVVFYDMTTIRTEGLSEQAGDLRQFGMSKEGLIARQVMLGVVQTADGLPLYHEIFEGNTGEVGTLKPIIEKIVQRYPVKRIIAVADRGLLSIDNLADLQAMKLPSGQPLEFILAVPGRRYSEFVDLLTPGQTQCANAQQEVLQELAWNQLRLVVAHAPQAAREASAKRDAVIQKLEAQAAQWVGKLDAQDTGQRGRGRDRGSSAGAGLGAGGPLIGATGLLRQAGRLDRCRQASHRHLQRMRLDLRDAPHPAFAEGREGAERLQKSAPDRRDRAHRVGWARALSLRIPAPGPGRAAVDGGVEHDIVDTRRQLIAAAGIPVIPAIDRRDPGDGQRLDLGFRRGAPEPAGQCADRDAQICRAAGVARMVDIAALVPDHERKHPVEIISHDQNPPGGA
jgi:hypothetical protein